MVVFCFPCFCKCEGDLFVYTSRVLDDRQCFTARSARRKKKIEEVESVEAVGQAQQLALRADYRSLVVKSRTVATERVNTAKMSNPCIHS